MHFFGSQATLALGGHRDAKRDAAGDPEFGGLSDSGSLRVRFIMSETPDHL